MKMDTRQKILDAAGEEFVKFGLAGARVDRIAMKSQVNKAMLYYHFHSKEKLYQAIIDGYLAKIGDFLEETIFEVPDLETLLYKVAEFYSVAVGCRNNFMPIMLREIASGGQRIERALTNIISQKGLAEKLKKLMYDGIKSGKFRKVDIKQSIISFVGMNLFYLMLAPTINSVWEIRDEKQFRDRRPKEVVDLFLCGLKKR